MDSLQIIKSPLMTERSTMQKEADRVYAFMVEKRATKDQIRQAVEELFNVDVLGVRTSLLRGKLRRMGRNAGYRPDRKKAFVKIKEGQEIKIAEQ